MAARVLHTREHAAPLSGLLEARGVVPVHVPLISRVATGLGPPSGTPATVLFTSPAAVRTPTGLREAISGAVCVAIGPATAAALRARGVTDVRVGDRGGAGAVELLGRVVGERPGRVWHVRGRKTSRTVEEALRDATLEPTPWFVYETRAVAGAGVALRAAAPFDVVCFASASAARAYVAADGDRSVPCVALGGDSAAGARAAGLQVRVVAARPELWSLADAALLALSAPSGE